MAVTFQFPLWQEMRKEGLPVEGFCIAAGIPTLEKAVEIIEGLKAEDIDAVFDQGPQCVCILQGPVAATWSIVKDELVKDLLGNINKTLIKRLLECKYGGNELAVPTIDYLAVAPQAAAGLPAGIVCTESAGAVTYHFGKTLPETSAWLETLGGDKLNWIRALITSNLIVQGTSYIDNPLCCILAPRAGQKIVVKYSGSTPASITLYGAVWEYLSRGSGPR